MRRRCDSSKSYGENRETAARISSDSVSINTFIHTQCTQPTNLTRQVFKGQPDLLICVAIISVFGDELRMLCSSLFYIWGEEEEG